MDRLNEFMVRRKSQAETEKELRANILCRRCADIPWEGPLDLQSNQLEQSIVIHETVAELQRSPCRICRFLADFFSMHGTAYNTHTLGWEVTDLFGPNEICRIRLTDTSEVPIIDAASKSKSKVPVIYVSRQDLIVARTRTQFHFPREVDIGRVRRWIGECQTEHEGSCVLVRKRHLSNLKVIDCDQEKVVPAPSHCKFVALSYVWGTYRAPPPGRNRYSLQDLPNTIRDSIRLTRDLGYRYLWVDRYVCEPQTSPSLC